MRRWLLASLTLLLLPGVAYAVPVPSPDMGFGVAGLVMLAGAAFLAHRRRRV
jgi:LPXTG-motif cell wall-anchored protein